jgi:uncharacterized repeat protein (TIGR01451 family)/uncharacterized delta-60 repeat protein
MIVSGLRGRWCLLPMAVGLIWSSEALAQPANDNFAAGQVLTGPAGVVTGSNVGATKEPNEPDVAGNPGGASVWFTWTSPISDAVNISTIGSTFDTILGVYTGNSVDSLTLIAANDDVGGGSLQSSVSFVATAGKIYHIAVDGFDAATGTISLNYGKGFSAGDFRFTSSLYMFGESEFGFGVLNGRMSIAGPRVTVTRTGGSVGKASIDYNITNLLYTNFTFITVTVTNIYMTNQSGSTINFTNYNLTNIMATYRYQDNEWGQWVYLPIDNWVTNRAFTNINGSITSLRTNIYLGTNAFPTFDCLNFTGMTNYVDTNPPPSTNILVTNYMCTNFVVTNLVPTAVPFQDYFPPFNGTLDFDDYQMSTDIFPIFVPDEFFRPFPPPPKEVNRVLSFTLSNPLQDPFESTDIAAPTAGSRLTNAILNILDQDVAAPSDKDVSWGWPGTNVFNFEYATIRCSESVNGFHVARIYVRRSSLNFSQATSVDYRINFIFPFNNSHNLFSLGGPEIPLQAGSDYATPPNIESGVFSPSPIDYTPVTGTLNWGANDGVDKFIDIPINDDSEVEFNEDLLVQLYFSGGTPPITDKALGYVQTCVLTTMFDDQPAGAVDRAYNKSDDATTDPPYNQLPGPNGAVLVVAVQPDGRTLLAGNFSAYNTVPQNHIARANPDGQIDHSFNPPPASGADDFVSSLSFDSGGKILIGGGFHSFNGVARSGVARLNGDGSLDPSFNPGTGAAAPVRALARQNNGMFIVAGEFGTFNGLPHPKIVRVDTNGVVDPSFNVGSGPNGNVLSVAVQPDGKILIGGQFTAVAGNPRNRIARLNTDGSLDFGFNPGSGADDSVNAIAVQTDGNIVIAGAFRTVSDNNRNRIARLTPSGALDFSFGVGTGLDNTAYTLQLQTDGNILVGGLFNSYNQTRRECVARILPNGMLDTSFMDTAYNQFAGLPKHYHSDDTENHPFIQSLSLQPDGNLMIGGTFTRVGGGFLRDDVLFRQNFGRLIGGSTPGPGNLSLDRNAYTGDENGGTLFIRMTRDNGHLGPASVNVVPLDQPAGPGAAVANQDYSFDLTTYGNPTWIVTYPNPTWQLQDGSFGQNNGFGPTVDPNTTVNYLANDVVINMIDNTVVDGNRQLNLELLNPGSRDLFLLGGEKIPLGVGLGRSAANVTIVDNDTLAGTLSFASTNFNVSEGGTNAVVGVIRTGGSAGSVSVAYTTADGTATNGVDYKFRSGTLTFGPGATTNFFTVPIIDDSISEDDETILIQLSHPTGGAQLGLSNAVVTIIDNDSPNGRLGFSSPAYTTNENSGAAVITVNRRGGSQGTLAVYYATSNGTAISGTHYTGVTNLLAWNPGDLSPKSFVIPILDNQLVDGSHSMNLRIFSPTVNGVTNNTTLGGASNAVVTIVDDDAYGSVAFSRPTYNVNENGGPAVVTIRRTSGIAQSVTVNFATSGGTAVPGFDYSPTNGVLAFAPGEISKSINIPILNNQFQDGNRFIGLVLSNATPVASLGFPSAAIVHIVDDETFNEPAGSPDTALDQSAGFNGDIFGVALQPNGMILAAGDFTIANNIPRSRIARLNTDGTLETSFSDTSSSIDAAVRAIVAQTDGRILIGGFFTNVNGVGSSHFARLNYSGTVDTSFNLGAGADSTVFGLAETFAGTNRQIYLGGAFVTVNGTSLSHIARLNDDGTVDPTFNPGIGADGTVFAVLPYPTNSVRAGQVLIAGDFLNYNAVSRTRVARLNADGSLDRSFAPISGANDSIRTIALQSDEHILIGGLFTNVNGTARSRIARLNPDGSLDASFNPGVGANDFVSTIAIQPDNRILVGGQFTLCNGVTRNHITRLNTDGSVDPQINFGLGSDAIVNSLQVQPDDKILLGGGFTHYDGIAHDRFLRIYGRTITGSGSFEFDASDYFVNERGTNGIVTVRRRGGTSGAPTGNVSLTLSTSNGTAVAGINYTAVTTNLVFPPGEIIKSVAIPVFDDAQVNPDRTVNLLLSNPQPSGGPTIGNQGKAVLNIINDDSAISFSSATYSINEDTSVGAALIQINRSGYTNGSSTVDFVTTTNGTALPGINYQPVTNTAVFNPGDTFTQVQIPVIHDPRPSGDKTVTMVLSNAVGSILLDPSQATLTVIDVETAPGEFTFASTNFLVGEADGSALITVIRTNGHSRQVSVNFGTTNGTALAGVHYVTTNGSLVFADGELTKSFTIPIINDNIVQGPRVLTVGLSSPQGGATISGTNVAPVTILDDDVGLGFSSPVYAVGEGAGSVTLSVLRQNGSNGVFSIDYATTNGTATAGADYTSTTGRLSFASGETLKTITIPILEDNIIEGDETFAVNLFNVQPPSAGQLIASSARVTIVDNDTGFYLSNSVYSVSEAGTNILITVMRTNASVADTNSVAVFTSDGTATAGSDYTFTSAVLTFTNGENFKTISIPILQDTLVEGDETFFVSLTNATGGAQIIGPSNAVVTIVDDDSGIKFSSSAYSVSESGVSSTITVQRFGILTNTVTVHYATEDGTATAGADYVGTSGTLVFTNGETTKTFNVQIIDDTLIEGNETVLLTLSSVFGQASLQVPNVAILTIIDNDGSLIVPAGAALLGESFSPPNGAIDPGENVSFLFAFRNSIGTPTTNLVATLLSGNGVTAPSGPQPYGVLLPGGGSVARNFGFTASGTNGGTITATFQLQDGPLNLGTNVFTFALGTNATRFTNNAAIAIRDNTNALPYPSSITVSGLNGVIGKAAITLTNLAHTYPADIDILLSSPSGQNVLVLANNGGANSITNVNLTLDPSAGTPVPINGQITTGTNRPNPSLPVATFPAPAAPGPYATNLSALAGSNPNGTWSLYVMDSRPLDSGSISGGWILSLTTAGVIPASVNLSANVTASPNPVVVGSNLTYTIYVTNYGPSTATAVSVTNVLPPSATFVSASGSGYTLAGNVLTFTNLGSMPLGASTALNVTVRPLIVSTITNTVTVAANETDAYAGDNTFVSLVTVASPTADVSLTLLDAPDPATIGSSLTYTLIVSNAGPATATSLKLTNTLPAGVTFVSASPAGYSLNGNVVTFPNLGDLGGGSTATATIVVQPTISGIITNNASAGSTTTDPLKVNNSASVKTVVQAITLTAARAGQNIIISWPASASGYVLESAADLHSPITWTQVTSPPPQLVGDQMTITITPTNGGSFFRLHGSAP